METRKLKLIQDGKLLYHLTSLDNIKSIIAHGLMPRVNANDFDDVAEQDIIDFRDKNNISNCVPFHFFFGTPFAGDVQISNSNKEFVYITIHRDIAKEHKFKIYPTHPRHMQPLRLYDYEEGMKEINWDLMNGRDYSNDECKQVCMAECLYEGIVPSKRFYSIVVKSTETKEFIEKSCQSLSCDFYIDVASSWFVDT